MVNIVFEKRGIHINKQAQTNIWHSTDLRLVLPATAIIIILSAIFHQLPLTWSVVYSDIVPFYQFAAQPGIFYIDKPVEYPVLTGLFIQLAQIIGKTPKGYYIISSLFLLLSALLCTYILHRIAPDKGKIYRYWIFSPSMLIFAIYNWDLIAIAFFLLAAYSLLAKRRNYLVSVLLSLGFSSKLYPAMYLLPLIAKTRGFSHRLKTIGIFGTVCLIVNLPFALLNFNGWYYFFSFNNQRLPNPDSIWGVLHYYIPQMSVMLINNVSLLIFVLAIIVVLWKHRDKSFLTLCFALTLILLICNKVFSPQYTLWLLPFFVLTPVNKKTIFYSLEICNLIVLFTILAYIFDQSHPSEFLIPNQIFVILRHTLLIYLLFLVLRTTTPNQREKNAVTVSVNYLSVTEAAKIIGVRPKIIKRLCAEGKLTAKRINNRWLISSDIVHSFADEYRRKGRGQTGS